MPRNSSLGSLARSPASTLTEPMSGSPDPTGPSSFICGRCQTGFSREAAYHRHIAACRGGSEEQEDEDDSDQEGGSDADSEEDGQQGEDDDDVDQSDADAAEEEDGEEFEMKEGSRRSKAIKKRARARNNNATQGAYRNWSASSATRRWSNE